MNIADKIICRAYTSGFEVQSWQDHAATVITILDQLVIHKTDDDCACFEIDERRATRHTSRTLMELDFVAVCRRTRGQRRRREDSLPLSECGTAKPPSCCFLHE